MWLRMWVLFAESDEATSGSPGTPPGGRHVCCDKMPFASFFLISEHLNGENETPATSFAGFLTGIISFSSPELEDCGYYVIVINPTN